jgi:hypothetical protein
VGMRLRLIFVTAVGCLWALAGAASPVVAECTGLDTWPSFSHAAPVAERVFIGTVVESYADDSTDHAITFRLRVDAVLRGDVPNSIENHDVVRSGAPLVVCPDDSILRVRVGDVWAFADGARLKQYPDEVLAVAIVNRRLDEIEQFLMPGVEHLSRSAIQGLIDGPPTDSVAVPLAAPTSSNLWGIAIAALVGGLLALRRACQRPNASRDIRRR